MNFAWSYWNVAYPAAILWGGIIWPCGAFEGRQTIYVPSSVLEGPAVRSLSKFVLPLLLAQSIHDR
jgi:hypothetical protein